MAERMPRVLGLTWRKFHNEEEENNENEGSVSPCTRNKAGAQKRMSDTNIGSNAPKKVKKLGRRLSQAVSSTGLGMMETLGSFKNKMRSSTRRRKRLFELHSPYRTPLQEVEDTPPPSQRRSERIAQRTEMYSPFTIDTPSSTTKRTPAKIRMGTHTPKRFNFSSPGQLQKDVNTMEENLKHLNELSEALSGTGTPRSKIRTTPGGRRSSASAKRRPIFV